MHLSDILAKDMFNSKNKIRKNAISAILSGNKEQVSSQHHTLLNLLTHLHLELPSQTVLTRKIAALSFQKLKTTYCTR